MGNDRHTVVTRSSDGLALVFGRSGRMSHDFAGYGVYEAAREVRFDYDHNQDVVTLYLKISGPSIDRQRDEKSRNS